MMWSINKLIFTTTSMVVCPLSAKVEKFSFGNKIRAKWTLEQEVVLVKLGATFPDRTHTIIAKNVGKKEAIIVTFQKTTST